MAQLDPVDRIQVSNDGVDIFLVAGSFEPRSVRGTQLLEGNVERSLVFNYDDTFDTEMGRRNTRQIEDLLRAKSQSVDVVHCKIADPFSVVLAIHTYITRERLLGSIRSVILDATCFTKLHLLLLLRFLEDRLRVDTIRICYTKPLSYATAFGKELSYGIRNSVYLPYHEGERVGTGTGLIALLGHEPQRLERLVQEIEPDYCVMLLGEPGFTTDMAQYSARANERLIRRAKYDRRYRYDVAPVSNIVRCEQILYEKLTDMRQDGCEHVYIAPLGTKLQALAIHLLSQRKNITRLSLAYTIPERYERRNYSHGIEHTVVTTLVNQTKRVTTGIDPIPAGGAVVTDAQVKALRDELGI